MTKGQTVVREVRLKPTTTVGRSRDSDLRISSSLVSRDHCVVFEQQGTWVVKDLGSTNGTLVNGNVVAEQVLLPGDELTVGPVNFRVAYQGAGAPPGVEPTPPASKRPQSPVLEALDEDDQTPLAAAIPQGEILEAQWIEDDGAEDEVVEAVPLEVVDEINEDDPKEVDAVDHVRSAAQTTPAGGAALQEDEDDDEGLGELFARLRGNS